MSGSDWTQTPNLALYKPIPGADDDQWGDRLNVNADVLDNSLLTTGGTMTGPLNLPNGTLAAPSLQVGANDGTGISRTANTLILGVQNTMGLALFANTAQFYGSLYMLNNRIQQVADATAPGDALNQRTGDARYAPLSGAGAYLPLTGGTLTGPLMVPAGTVTAPGLTVGTNSSGIYGLGSTTAISSIGTQVASYGLGGNTSLVPLSMNNQRITSLANATAATDALNQQTGDARYAPIGAGGASVTVSDTPPASPSPGNLWYDSANLGLFIRYQDANSAQWVVANNQNALPDAPSDANTYGRHNATWAAVAPAAALNNVGRNLLHNPLFNVAQRGVGNFTANLAYTMDRWQIELNLDTLAVSRGVASDAVRATIGDEAMQFVFNANVTGNAGAASYSLIEQKMEGVRRLSGKTVTVSFYAGASVAGLNLGVSIDQVFGTGGSPSAGVSAAAPQSVALGTVWARHSLTFVLASITGKTLGTNGDDDTRVRFWFSSGTSTSAAAGGIGVQSGIIQLWGVQLEVGSVATPLEKPDPRYDLANCMRFYQTNAVIINQNTNSAGVGLTTSAPFPVPMRVSPTMTLVNNNSINVNAITVSGQALNWWAQGVVAASGTYTLGVIVSASADL